MTVFTNEQIAADYVARVSQPDGGYPRPGWVYFMKLAGEAAEANEAFLRLWNYSRHTGDMRGVAAELADVVISAYAAAQVMDIGLDDAIQEKHAVLTHPVAAVRDGVHRDETPGSVPA